MAINIALKQGHRGLPGGASLARLLAEERGVRNRANLPQLSQREILRWAAAHRRRTGEWPTRASGPVTDAPGETWSGVDAALAKGARGLRGGTSLAKLLARHGGRPHQRERPLTIKLILSWADAHNQRTGRWPTGGSGHVQDAPGERWKLIDQALRLGQRGLPGGSSLFRLLVRKRGRLDLGSRPKLTEATILQWAKQHFEQSGHWPKSSSGIVADQPGETWAGVDASLRHGRRGLPGGSSLAKLLAGAHQVEQHESELSLRG